MKKAALGGLVLGVCTTLLTGCCSPHGVPTHITFDPAGTHVAYLWEDHWDGPVVDGKIWRRTISLHWCAADMPEKQSSVMIDMLGADFKGYVSVPMEIKWSPSGTHVGVLTPQKFVLVDVKTKRTHVVKDSGTIKSFAWLSNDEIVYCARRLAKGNQQRVICRQTVTSAQRTDVVAFDWYSEMEYTWQEHWSPSGEYVVVMEPALRGRFHMVDVQAATARPFGQGKAHDEGVAWSRDSKQAFCVSDTVGPADSYEALLVSTNAEILADCTQKFRESFADDGYGPSLEPFWTTDGTYVIGNRLKTGGCLIQPSPWRIVPLGEILSSRQEVPEETTTSPWIFWMPTPGWVTVLPTGNEGNSPIKYAATYSGRSLVPLLKTDLRTEPRWALSPDGTKVATVDYEKRVRVHTTPELSADCE